METDRGQYRGDGRMKEMEVNIEQIEQDNLTNNPKQLRTDVYQALLVKDKRRATELLVQVLERKTKFYATQFDEANELYYFEEGIYKSEGKSFIKKFCRAILDEIYTEQLANEVCAKIEADSFIEQKEFFKPKNIDEICVLNGVLNIKTRELTDYTPDKIFFSKINAEYHVDAIRNEIETFKEVLR